MKSNADNIILLIVLKENKMLILDDSRGDTKPPVYTNSPTSLWEKKYILDEWKSWAESDEKW